VALSVAHLHLSTKTLEEQKEKGTTQTSTPKRCKHQELHLIGCHEPYYHRCKFKQDNNLTMHMLVKNLLPEPMFLINWINKFTHIYCCIIWWSLNEKFSLIFQLTNGQFLILDFSFV
jgi:hypothetical protein